MTPRIFLIIILMEKEFRWEQKIWRVTWELLLKILHLIMSNNNHNSNYSSFSNNNKDSNNFSNSKKPFKNKCRWKHWDRNKCRHQILVKKRIDNLGNNLVYDSWETFKYFHFPLCILFLFMVFVKFQLFNVKIEKHLLKIFLDTQNENKHILIK